MLTTRLTILPIPFLLVVMLLACFKSSVAIIAIRVAFRLIHGIGRPCLLVLSHLLHTPTLCLPIPTIENHIFTHLLCPLLFTWLSYSSFRSDLELHFLLQAIFGLWLP